MDTEELKNEVRAILEVVELCPPELRAKCFELLLADYLAENRMARPPIGPAITTPQLRKSPPALSPAAVLPEEIEKRMRAFAGQYSLNPNEMLKVYHVDDLGNVSIEATDLRSSQNSKRQRRLALLLGGRHQFQEGSFSVPTEELRELCVTYSAYDAANFMANLKNAKEIFAGFKADATNKLSPVGKAELGALLKELISQ